MGDRSRHLAQAIGYTLGQTMFFGVMACGMHMVIWSLKASPGGGVLFLVGCIWLLAFYPSCHQGWCVLWDSWERVFR